MENHIQVNGIPDFTASKEISCRDCGHRYQIPASSISSTCERCGNIAFHPEFTTETVAKSRAQERLFAFREIPKRVPVATPKAREYHEIARNAEIDPLEIEAIAIQNQQEWQLWARISENFADPNRHLAYLSFVSRNLCFDRAAERYKTHRLRFLQIPEEAWQVERADEMLGRISALCAVQFERALFTRKSDFELWAAPAKKKRLRPMIAGFFLIMGAMIAVNWVITIFFR